ncbi:hypothetical protein KY290_007737 [Solanum tuberosum]|uniref:Uncharacterized protein n=1 Tax=Solanum tuberosum TaxID=4113 RepID=A0ABQ7W7Q6_SOLTU|nr:hypothetical protein KY290_007737 [Solanum tuberosum]
MKMKVKYFDSLDPRCDTSEDEGDHAESDEVVDPPARNASTKEITYVRLAGIAVGIANRGGLAKLSIRGNNLFCGMTDVGLKSIGRGFPTLRELSSWNVSFVCDEGLSEIANDCHLSEKLDLF